MSKHDVFISYSQHDKTVADAACARLEARGVRCWIAPRDVAAGATWGSAIVEAISTSRIMVLIFSGHANASDQVLREVTTAVNRGITLVPFRLDNVPLSQDLTYFLSPVHWLDALTPPLEHHLATLVQRVLTLLSQYKSDPSTSGVGIDANASMAAPAISQQRAAQPTQNVFARRIVGVGIASIVVLGAIVWWLNKPFEDPTLTSSADSPAATTVDTSLISWRPNESTATLLLPKGVQMHFVWIAPGTSQMGGGPDRAKNIEHEITLTKGYWIGTTEVTQGQWKSLMGSNPSVFIGDSHPVDSVSWDDCHTFTTRLNGSNAGIFRLPTEAEWEYACVANSSLQDRWTRRETYAWFAANSGQVTHPVATRRANEWGLYDVHGNVAEWCSDWLGHYSADPQTDPTGPATGTFRVTRGGSWKTGPDQIRARNRIGTPPSEANSTVGFRIVRES